MCKQWLIGLENGLTQPKALKALLKLDNSEVRVPYGRKIIRSPGLCGGKFLHPKIYSVRSTERSIVVSASGNLTHGGLRSNVEQLLAWIGDPGNPVEKALIGWWSTAWKAAEAVDQDLIDAYAEVRPNLRIAAA